MKMNRVSSAWLCLWTMTFAAGAYAQVTPAQYVDVQDIVVKPPVAEMIYAPAHHKLIMRHGSTSVAVLDLVTNTTTVHRGKAQLTSMSLSASQSTLFVSDYGGEIRDSHGVPLGQSYVHALDLKTGQWRVDTSYTAGAVEALSDTTLVLKNLEEISFTNNAFKLGGALKILNTDHGWTSPAYDAGVNYGNFRYDYRTGRLIHGSTYALTRVFQVFTIGADNNFARAEGASHGYSGTVPDAYGVVALSTDGSAFYCGAQQVDARDVTRALNVFPEQISAANASVAFGFGGHLYSAQTGVEFQYLGFYAAVYAPNPDPAATDFWVWDRAVNTVRHYVQQ